MPIISPSGGGGGAVTAAKVTRTAGSITTNSNGVWAELAAATGGPGSGGLDVTLACAAGDVILFGASALMGNSTPTVNFDVATIVSAAPVSTLGGSALNASNGGIVAWNASASVAVAFGGAIMYTAVSGDITGGNIVLRPYYISSGALNRTLFAVAADPLQFWAVNLKH